MSLSATLFGRDSAIFRATNILGLGIPGWLDRKFGAPETEGPRLSDLSVQVSTYGADIPRLYGTISVMGNVIWLENNKLKETVRKKKSGGKGGGGSSEPTKTYSYSATFHLALCEGPIAGVRRIWCGDNLIYNAGSSDLETIIASNEAAKGWKLYLGTDDQLPDPRYEADLGVGQVSAHRGLAYIAFYDFKLADYSNSLQGAQFKVEVVMAGKGTQLITDTTLQATTPVTWESGASFRDDFRGVSFLSRRAVGSADVGELNLGRYSYEGPFVIESNLDNVAARGCVSYDGDMWIASLTNDIFSTTIFRRASDYHYFSIAADRLVRGIRKAGEEYILLFTGGGAGTSGTFTSAGKATVFSTGGIVYDSIPATAGFRINTSGDQLHEFRLVSNSLTWHTYDDELNFIAQHSAIIPGDAIENVTTAFASNGIGTQSCMRNGVVYLCIEILGGYRIVALSPSGVIDDYTVSATSGIAALSAFYMLSEFDGYIVNGPRFIQFRRSPGGNGVSLSDVVSAECERSSLLLAPDIESSGLSNLVRGYRVSGGSIRSALEPLQLAYPFDVRQRGYSLQFLPRGGAVNFSVSYSDLGANGNEILAQSREMDTQLPARTAIKSLDAAREYAIGEQYSERLNTEAVNKVDREMPLVLNANEAAGIAEMLNFVPWLERTDFSFSLPPTYRFAEPGDILTLELPESLYQLRLDEVNETQGGRVECKAKPNSASLYLPNASGSEGVPPAGTIPLLGPAIFIPLDIPVVDETLQDAVGFVGVMTGESDSWPGGLAVRSNDGGQTWAELQAYSGPATLGLATNTLPASNCTLIDNRSLTVGVISGEFESITRDQMLSGLNYAAYGVDGRWEIVRFQSATIIASGVYLITGFVRGERGTEWATGLHQVGDYFILLDDPDNAFIGAPVESLTLERQYRGVTSGASLDDADDVFFAYQGVNLEPLSPVYAKGTRDVSGNLSGQFTRRSRLSSSWWANGVSAPVGEASESFEIDVMSGTTVVRTIISSSPAFSYSAANQTTDFGSPQSSISFKIYQLSAIVGRGYPLEVTL